MVFCMLISQGLEFASGALGSKWFGGTKWGSIGAIIGGIVGIFFMPFGLILGPLFGAIIAEWVFAQQDLQTSSKSGVGSVFGVIVGMITKGGITILMVALFLLDALAVF